MRRTLSVKIPLFSNRSEKKPHEEIAAIGLTVVKWCGGSISAADYAPYWCLLLLFVVVKRV